MGPVPTMAVSQMLWEVGGVGWAAPLTLSQPPHCPPPQAAGSPRPLPVALLRFPDQTQTKLHGQETTRKSNLSNIP